MAEKKKLETIVSPAGTAAYCWVRKPDTKFDVDGVYKLTLVLDKDDAVAKRFVKMINDEHAKVRGKKRTESPVKDGDDKDNDEFHGKWLVNFKSKFQPKCVDAKRNELPDDIFVMSGDLVKVAFAINPYEKGANAGVSLQLRAVQLLDKRNHGADYSDAFDEEDGFEAGGEGDGEESTKNLDF